ncbi:MAG: hypothetical protein LBS10_03855 [Gracilibacteraceae bacterium]|jgi:hypothetical protein|nr:hypothetical protein [Gracilibacteraceae bacterium]
MLNQLKKGVQIEFIDTYFNIAAGTAAVIEKVDYKTGRVDGVTADEQKFSINYFDTKSSFRVKTTCLTGFEIWDYLLETYGFSEARKIAFDFIKEAADDADSRKFCYELREAVKKAILEVALSKQKNKEE